MYSQNEEDDYVQPPLPTFSFNLQPQQELQTQTLIIGMYGPASLFLSSFANVDAPIAKVNFNKAKQKSLATIYGGQACIYMIFNDEIQKMKEINFCAFVNKYFRYKEIIILTNIARGMLENNVGGNLLHISTSEFKNPLAPKFKEGWSGIEADLIAFGQRMKIPMVCYIGVVDEYQMEKSIISSMFGCLSGKQLQEPKFDNSKEIKKYNMGKHSKKLYL